MAKQVASDPVIVFRQDSPPAGSWPQWPAQGTLNEGEKVECRDCNRSIEFNVFAERRCSRCSQAAFERKERFWGFLRITGGIMAAVLIGWWIFSPSATPEETPEEKTVQTECEKVGEMLYPEDVDGFTRGCVEGSN